MILQDLKTLFPNENWTFFEPFVPFVDTELPKFGINTPLRKAHFLAQVAHESNGFRFVVENLNYSDTGLFSNFRKYFPTLALARQFARQPQRIANKVYADRMGNGNEASGEGWKFRGRGLIQLTGKNNYQRFSTATGTDFVANPDLLAQAPWALSSAAWYWQQNNVNRFADADNIVAVTRAVNGGTIGLSGRLHYLEEFKRVLGL
jgi:putative chitinase